MPDLIRGRHEINPCEAVGICRCTWSVGRVGLKEGGELHHGFS